jgi:hypothetical protein
MPGKTAKSTPLAPCGLSGMTALARAATLLRERRKIAKNARKIGSHRETRVIGGWAEDGCRKKERTRYDKTDQRPDLSGSS